MTTLPSTVNRLEAERAELEALLASDSFGRSSNVVRFLTFICEQYFAGRADAIKEYSIAVEALGRPQDFDPQSDTIVRVTAHALRRRLEEYYRTTGAEHAVHIYLPPGHYVPNFVHRQDRVPGNGNGGVSALEAVTAPKNGDAARAAAATEPPMAEAAEPAVAVRWPARLLILAAVIGIAAVAVLGWWQPWKRKAATGGGSPTLSAPAADLAIRVLVGERRDAYTDRAGRAWQEDRFCTGGTSFAVEGRTIQGTDDARLFSAGRSGAFQCRIPVNPGFYEVRLFFAETAGLQENTRNFTYSINGGAAESIDVVDDAAGNDVATTKVFVGVQPAGDGAIHLDFAGPNSFLNGIEIVAGEKDRMLPVRIVTGHSSYRDAHANVWLPDRYAFGGRLSRSSGELSAVADGGLYEWQRIGHFHYVIPVALARAYTVKLYFREPWFGARNGNPGGVGSRIFDVACNGSVILKNFDILAQNDSEPVIRAFPHIQPTAQGKIELYFTPVLNYPSVNAIEIIPE